VWELRADLPAKSDKGAGEKMIESYNIIVAGVGGQGNVLASRIIGDAAINEGYHVVIGETFGAGQRGGSVLSHIRLSKEKKYGPLIPQESADLVIGLEPFEALKCAADFLKPNGAIVTNTYPIMPSDRNYPSLDDIFSNLRKLSSKLFLLDSTEIAKEIGDIASSNIVMIGAAFASGVLPLKEQQVKDAITERLSKAADLNVKAFEKGKKMVKQQ
jgi:indolepyruvate ferredoxin oxidoreductase beta subunit